MGSEGTMEEEVDFGKKGVSSEMIGLLFRVMALRIGLTVPSML